MYIDQITQINVVVSRIIVVADQLWSFYWTMAPIFIYLFIFFFTHNQLEINHSACRNKDCE